MPWDCCKGLNPLVNIRLSRCTPLHPSISQCGFVTYFSSKWQEFPLLRSSCLQSFPSSLSDVQWQKTVPLKGLQLLLKVFQEFKALCHALTFKILLYCFFQLHFSDFHNHTWSTATTAGFFPSKNQNAFTTSTAHQNRPSSSPAQMLLLHQTFPGPLLFSNILLTQVLPPYLTDSLSDHLELSALFPSGLLNSTCFLSCSWHNVSCPVSSQVRNKVISWRPLWKPS